MAIDRIHLRRLLQYIGLPADRRLAAVRADARSEVRKRDIARNSGGDFHSCFWADAKAHAAGVTSLITSTKQRIDRNENRERLYPLLTKGFLDWWNERRRWINEDIELIPQTIGGPHNFVEIEGTVKVENILALKVGGQNNRLIYPYFAETPTLSEDVARMGLWLMGQALPDYDIADMRILDVLRGESFSVDRYPLTGNEGAVFVERYAKMLNDWREFIKEFGN